MIILKSNFIKINSSKYEDESLEKSSLLLRKKENTV